MLSEHLSQAHDAASRRTTLIDSQVEWIDRELLGGKPSRVLDLGCGPGLYLVRLAQRGHVARGIDFSPASVAYARKTAKAQDAAIEVTEGDLREVPFDGPYDLVMMLFGELNVFRPEHAFDIVNRSARSLKAGGRFLLELSSYDTVKGKARPPSWYPAPAGLWSDRPHLVLQESSWNDASQTCATRYFVIDARSNAVSRYAATYKAYSDDGVRELLTKCAFANPERIAGWDAMAGDSGMVAWVAERC